MPTLRRDFEKYRAFIFDIDDTLIVTFDIMWKMYAETAIRQGYAYADDREFMRGIWGTPMVMAFPPAFPGIDLEQAHRDLLSLLPDMQIVAQNGALELLALLESRGARVGAVTAGELARIQATFTKLGVLDQFTGNIYGGDNLTYFKPDPRALNPLVEGWATEGVTLDEIVMIGDSLHDYQPAKERGVTFYAVLTGLSTADQFAEAGLPPERMLRSLTELLV